jgi:hypothetical protein
MVRPALCLLGFIACTKAVAPLIDAGNVDAGQDAGSRDAGQDAGIDAGIDCSRHCTIDGGTYCANETAGGWYTCSVCQPDQSTTSWTTLPVGTACVTPAIQASPGRGECFAQGGTGIVYCTCGTSTVCHDDNICCQGSCLPLQGDPDAGISTCQLLAGQGPCFGSYICRSGVCCSDGGLCSADDGTCPPS